MLVEKDTKFELQRHELAKAVHLHLDDEPEQRGDEHEQASLIKKIIQDVQTEQSFGQWYFDSNSERSPIFFPNNEVVDRASFDALNSNPDIEKMVFDDSSFLDFVYTEYKYAELLLSTDSVDELFRKHIKNIEDMVDLSANSAKRLAKTKKTKSERLGRIMEARQKLQSSSNKTSHKTALMAASDESKSECEVSEKKPSAFFFFFTFSFWPTLFFHFFPIFFFI